MASEIRTENWSKEFSKSQGNEQSSKEESPCAHIYNIRCILKMRLLKIEYFLPSLKKHIQRVLNCICFLHYHLISSNLEIITTKITTRPHT